MTEDQARHVKQKTDEAAVTSFARKFLHTLSRSLKSGHPELEKTITGIYEDTVKETPKDPGAALVDARKVVGKDNSAYLSNGLMMLWCGEQPEDERHFASSNTISTEEQFGAVEQRVLERLIAREEDKCGEIDLAKDERAPTQIAYLLSVPEIREFMLDEMKESEIEIIKTLRETIESWQTKQNDVRAVLNDNTACTALLDMLQMLCSSRAQEWISAQFDQRVQATVEVDMTCEDVEDSFNGNEGWHFLPYAVRGNDVDVITSTLNYQAKEYDRRTLSSIIVCINDGLVCEQPPHLTAGPDRQDNYTVPEFKEPYYITTPHAGPPCYAYGRAPSGFLAFKEQSGSLSTYTAIKNTVLWTPTRRVKDTSLYASGTRNLSLNEISQAVAYCTYSSQHISLAKTIPSPASTWGAAVLKLEMLPSLRKVNGLKGVDIQMKISGGIEDGTETILNMITQIPMDQRNDSGIQSRRCIQITNKAPSENPPNETWGRRVEMHTIPEFATPWDMAALLQSLGGWQDRRNAATAQKQIYTDSLSVLKRGPGTRPASQSDAHDQSRRNALWEDSLRELAISGDRLYVFLRVMAGVS